MDIEQDTLSTPVNSVINNQVVQLNERATKALLRKIDLRLIPLLILLSVSNFIDRINIGMKKKQVSFVISTHLTLDCVRDEYFYSIVIAIGAICETVRSQNSVLKPICYYGKK